MLFFALLFFCLSFYGLPTIVAGETVLVITLIIIILFIPDYSSLRLNSNMAEELQNLREQLEQLRTENEHLRSVQAPPLVDAPATASTSGAQSTTAANRTNVDRLIFVPRDRKCPMFRGRLGINLSEWLEEAQACMRARHLSAADQAFFLYDHLEGEAREEIKYRSSTERSDPNRIISILQDLYGCVESYVALQEAFFSRRQQEGESLLEYSLALMALMEKVQNRAPNNMTNAATLLRDQFVEQLLDGALRRELKQYIRNTPTATLLDVRGEAMRWEREGLPPVVRGRSHSVPSAFGIQYAVQGGYQRTVNTSQGSEVQEMKEMLRRQQEQLDRLTHSITRLEGSNNPRQRNRSPRFGPIICRRCQQPGHISRDCDGQRAPPRSRPPRQEHPQPHNNPEN